MTNLSTNSRKWSICLLLTIFICIMFSTRYLLHTSSTMFLHIAAQEEETPWRKTKLGWVDLQKWDRPKPVAVERRIELLHPLALSAMMILMTTGLLIWSTEERQWSEAFSSNEKPRAED